MHELRGLCGELAVEANGAKAQMIERIVELHGYGKRMWPNGVVEQGQFVHGSLKAAEVA